MTDGDGFARLDAAVPLMGVDRVGGGVDVYARGDEAVVPDADIAYVEGLC